MSTARGSIERRSSSGGRSASRAASPSRRIFATAASQVRPAERTGRRQPDAGRPAAGGRRRVGGGPQEDLRRVVRARVRARVRRTRCPGRRVWPPPAASCPARRSGRPPGWRTGPTAACRSRSASALPPMIASDRCGPSTPSSRRRCASRKSRRAASSRPDLDRRRLVDLDHRAAGGGQCPEIRVEGLGRREARPPDLLPGPWSAGRPGPAWRPSTSARPSPASARAAIGRSPARRR